MSDGQIGSIGLGIVGAIAGAPFGLAPVGFALGSTIGGLAFSEGSVQRQEGPRLDDLKQVSSGAGNTIPILWGTQKLPGHVIWSSGIREDEDTVKREVGKGDYVKNTTYQYYASWAVSFCEGEVGSLARLWMDDKLIYSAIPSDVVEEVESIYPDGIEFPIVGLSWDLQPGLLFRFYRGSETQGPDPVIDHTQTTGEDITVSSGQLIYQGQQQVPAYRGLCYVVFENADLGPFGNRIPRVFAEITRDVTGGSNQLKPVPRVDPILQELDGTYQADEIYVDYFLRRIYTYNATGSPPGLYVYDMDDREAIREVTFPEMGFSGAPNLSLITGRGDLLFKADDNFYIVNPFSFRRQLLAENPFDESSGVTNFSYPSLEGRLVGERGTYYVFAGAQLFGAWSVFNSRTGQQVPFEVPSEQVNMSDTSGFGVSCLGRQAGTEVDFWGLDEGTVYRMTVGLQDVGGANEGPIITNVEQVRSLVPDDFLAQGYQTESTSVGTDQFFYNPNNDSVVVLSDVGYDNAGFPSYLDGSALALEPDGNILGLTPCPGYSGFGHRTIRHSRVGANNLVTLSDGTEAIFILDVAGMNVEFSEETYSTDNWTISTLNASVYDGSTGTLWTTGSVFEGVDGNYHLLTVKPQSAVIPVPISVGDVMRDMVARVGLSEDDVDTEGVDDLELNGYVSTRSSSIKSLIQNLTPLYFYDVIESDYLLKWVLRGSNGTVRSIGRENALERSDGWLSETRVDDLSMPTEVSISYQTPARDYTTETQSYKRINSPFGGTVPHDNKQSTEIAVSAFATQIRQAAEVGLMSAWAERINYKFSLPQRYIALDPADSIDLRVRDDVTERVRLTQLTLGANFEIESEAVVENPETYTGVLPGVLGITEADAAVTSRLPDPVPALFQPLPLTIVRDVDAVQGENLLFQWAALTSKPRFRGAALESSAEGLSFENVGSVASTPVYGYVGDPMPSVDRPFRIDYDSTLTVTLAVDGNLESVDEQEMLNGANMVAIVRHGDQFVEIINFADAAENPDGSWTLSTFARGRRGTDVFVNDHIGGELFLLLPNNENVISQDQRPASEYDTSRIYRMASTGQTVEEAFLDSYTNPAYDKMPWAPTHIEEDRSSGDRELTWIRRTRFNGTWRDSTSNVPLNESEELYDLEILDGGPEGTVVRTVSDLTSPSYTYLQSDFESDFGLSDTQYWVRVYQKSAVVGRGFAGIADFG